jgi:hypothetical protein
MTNKTPKQLEAIAASVRDQMLDVNLGLLSATEWAKRYDEAEALGAPLPMPCRMRRANLRGTSNARNAGL